MADLIAKTALSGLLPKTIGTVTASETDPGPLTSLAPFHGQAKPLSDALKSAHGMAFPAPGRATTGKDGARAIWFGQGQALLAGAVIDPALGKRAAITDQTDAWAAALIEGTDAAEVLSRLTPLDLRIAQFKRGHTARTELAHLSASLTRLAEDRFLILVFRSMAKTLVHDLTPAMETVAARRVV